MTGKIFRIIVLVLIVIISALIGVAVYQNLFSILDFQLVIYKYMLQGQELVGSVGAKANETVNTVLGRLGKEGGQANPTSANIASLETRLGAYTQKVKVFCGIIGTLTGLWSYKMLSSITFGLKKHLLALKSFIMS